MTIRFRDMLYGEITLPEWLGPFLRMPEFVRLRRVRLSNVDSIQFKDFAGPSRWEHCIAVATLSQHYARARGLDAKRAAQLTLAGLLHDVATPPYGHTVEYVLDNFDHEVESQSLLEDKDGELCTPSRGRYQSELPRFRVLCERASKNLGFTLDADEIARMVVGEGELGHVICGQLDVDNADNVTRAALFLGHEVRRDVPLRVVEWLARVDRVPANLDLVEDEAVQLWLSYRRQLYHSFFTCSEEEMGRQAFLQHLLRRAFRRGLSRQTVLSFGDEELLDGIASLEDLDEGLEYASLGELVDRYRLLEPTFQFLDVPIPDQDVLRTLMAPRATSWIERKLSSTTLEVLFMIAARREGVDVEQPGLFPPPAGRLLGFKLGKGLSHSQLPDWLATEIDQRLGGRDLIVNVNRNVSLAAEKWSRAKPWLELTEERRESIVMNLNAVGGWRFRLSRNEPIHWYPSTFVHAIPATLINSLGLQGELVVDCFGGTGQTALEALRHGGSAISMDSNTIACRIARATFTYLDEGVREWLSSLRRSDICHATPAEPPELDGLDRWFNPKTLEELCAIKGFANEQATPEVRDFLLVCFSAILGSCTERHGKEHAYFADNTPLPRGLDRPCYRDAFKEFTARVNRNVAIIDRLYGLLSRQGRSVQDELRRVRVVQGSVNCSSPASLGVESHSVRGIITSPPYLCTIDYSLGHRLSYAWLQPSALSIDFDQEIGPRRSRFATQRAVKDYFEGLRRFAKLAEECLAQGGVLATVLGSPNAKRFEDVDVMARFDGILEDHGFELLWSKWRPISWQRNFGLQSLRSERVSVHVLTERASGSGRAAREELRKPSNEAAPMGQVRRG